jgi:membrane fusion protein (multidrug efflux system)
MKKLNIKRIVGILVFAAIVVITIVTLMNNKEIAAEKIYEYDKSEPINVITHRVKLNPLNNEHRYSGTFQPNKEVKLSADTKGKITKVFVDNGNLVKEGQPLLELDKSMITLQLQAANTKISGLEKDIERYETLVESNAIQGVKLEKALLGLDAAKIERATIQEQFKKATVRAPFDGIITAKLTEKGAFAAPGVPLFQLTDISTLKFTILVTEYEVNEFHRNDTIQLSVDALTDEKFIGTISMVGSKANKSMNFPVEISLYNKSMQIKAGMFGHAKTSVSLGSHQGILIPLSAIIGETVAPKVYVVESGKAKLRDIELGGTITNKAIVKNGLSTEDVIVVEGITNLFDGANVITK